MDLRPPASKKQVFFDYYCPIEAGYKDRSGILPYDKAACRALESTYKKPKEVTGSEERTLFVARLPQEVEEADLEKAFSRYGELQETRLIRDLVTGAPRGYGFVVFARRRDAASARGACRRLCIAGADVVVEAEFSRGLTNWKPRRLGGGLGGKKESGQLRFGGVSRPFQVPISDIAGSYPGPGPGPGFGRPRRTERADTAAAGAFEERHSSQTARWRHRDEPATGTDRHLRMIDGATEEPSARYSERHWHEDGKRSSEKRPERRRDRHRDEYGDKHGGEDRDAHKDRRSVGDAHRDRHRDDRSGSVTKRHRHKDDDSDRDGDRHRDDRSGSVTKRHRHRDDDSDRDGDRHSGKHRRSEKHSERHSKRHKSRRDSDEYEYRSLSKKRHRDH